MRQRIKGFTIVELLIVIVVIGILATITIVAYNGIQSKARNAQLLSAIDAYEKAIRMYMTFYDGRVPTGGGGSAAASCLGENYPSADGYAANVCFTLGPVTRSAAVNNELKEFLSQLPNASENVFKLNGSPYARGVIYGGNNNAPGGPEFTLTYIIDGNQTCGRGVPYVDTIAGKSVTECTITSQ